MITFEQAREIIAAELKEIYPPIARVNVSQRGLENDECYQVFVKILSEDYFTIKDGPAYIVDKATGVSSRRHGHKYTIDNATRVGNWT